MLDDPNIPRHIKGCIKQELDSITGGNRKNIRNRKAMSQHTKGEWKLGFGYEHSNLQLKSLHRLQHKYDDNYGRLNKRVKLKI